MSKLKYTLVPFTKLFLIGYFRRRGIYKKYIHSNYRNDFLSNIGVLGRVHHNIHIFFRNLNIMEAKNRNNYKQFINLEEQVLDTLYFMINISNISCNNLMCNLRNHKTMIITSFIY